MGYFFDKLKVIRHQRAVFSLALSYWGRGTMRTIKRSLKTRRKKPSNPGEPPKVQNAQSPLKKLVLFAVDKMKLQVVIGPAFGRSKDRGRVPVPSRLEHGGSTVIRLRERRPRKRFINRERYFFSKTKWENARRNKRFLHWAFRQNILRDTTIKVAPRPFVAEGLRKYLASGDFKRALEDARRKCRNVK